MSVDGQPSLPLNSSGLGYAPPLLLTASGAYASMPTSGGSSFVLTGDMFGPATAFPDWVRYGPVGTGGVTKFTAGTPDSLGKPWCAVTIAHTEITCASAPGTGSGYSVQAAVGGQPSNVLRPPMSYGAPVMTAFTPPTGMATTGGVNVIITGTNFGPTGGAVPLSASYASARGAGATPLSFTPTNCTVTQADVQITCLTAPGAGANLQVRGGTEQ